MIGDGDVKLERITPDQLAGEPVKAPSEVTLERFAASAGMRVARKPTPGAAVKVPVGSRVIVKDR